MAITISLYDTFKTELAKGTHNFGSGGDTFKLALLNGHVFDAADDLFSDVSADEVAAGTGYTAGGEAVGSMTATDSSGTTTIDAADVTWSSLTKTTDGAVLYNSSKSNKLVAYIDFDGSQSPSAQDFTVQWSGSGIATVTG